MLRTALVADDDPPVRGTISRALRGLNWQVIEAADGCAALDHLSNDHIDLVILDQRMPQLSGLEVLTVMRESAVHRTTPVMVVTGLPDAEASRAMLQLGVVDYLVKPLKPDFIRERLTRLDRQVRATAPTRRPKGQGKRSKRSVLAIIDADAEHRNFVKTVLRPRYEVVEHPSGVHALRATVVPPPSIFLLGDDVGLIKSDFLARKLHEKREFADARIVRIAADPATVDPTGLDGVLTRTFVPTEFFGAFDQLLGPRFDTPGSVLNQVLRTVEGATEQTIGTGAGSAINRRTGDQSALQPDQVQAWVKIALEDLGIVVRLAVRATLDDARALSALMSKTPQDVIEDEDALSTMSEVVNIVAGRVKASLAAANERVTVGVPETASSCPDDAPSARDTMTIFTHPTGAFTLIAHLGVRAN